MTAKVHKMNEKRFGLINHISLVSSSGTTDSLYLIALFRSSLDILTQAILLHLSFDLLSV